MAHGAESESGVPGSLPSVADPGEEVTDADIEREAVVGRGGSATVSRASVRGTDAVLALKEPHATDAVPSAVVERFEREAETWARIDDHDHVLAVHGWGTDPHPWLALEYADGGSLADAADWGIDRVVWAAACVATALERAHGEGIAHLDLTPGNVLLCEAGEGDWAVPKVADWGLARALGAETANLEGLSPRYAAPEQFAPDRFGAPGAATDVYALGVVVYELLVGSPPFEGSPLALRRAVVDEAPPPASGRNPDLPGAVDDVLDRALAKDPADRYDSMADFRRALRGLADVAPTGSDPLAGVAGRDPRPGSETDAATAVGTVEPTTPYDRAVVLADEGFVELTPEYFARRDPAPPLAAWRRGVTLADARAGRAVDRTVPEDGDRVDLVERVLGEALSGTEQVVLGPPGSGKSTVCKRVACEWFDRGHGPVFYRESGESGRFDDPDALARRVTGEEGHALVVVEDAVRPAARAVFEFRERVADADVTVLVDARESEWRDTGRGGGPFDDDPVTAGRGAFDPVYVPRPDRREHERFVRAVERAADRSLDVDLEQLQAAVQQVTGGDEGGAQPGELFYLLHRLTALAGDPLVGTDETTLTETVTEVYDELAAVGEDALDAGVCVNVCNGAGLGVHPELLYAAVDDPLAVDEALDALDGRVVFPREADWGGEPTAYPSVHEAWSEAFLVHLLDTEGEAAARERFGRVVTRLLSLADDATARERVADALPDGGSYLARIERDPVAWADETIEAVFALGRERAKLAPLYGDGERDAVALPSVCSPSVAAEVPVWLGRAFLAGDYYDCAERAFQRLSGEDVDHALDRLVGLVSVASNRGDFDQAVTRTEECIELAERADRPVDRARAQLEGGWALTRRGDFDDAEAYYRSALGTFREMDDRDSVAETLSALGSTAVERGAYDRARDHLERSLELYREVGDRHGQADDLHNLGMVALRQGEYEAAGEYFERSLELERDLGRRLGVATSLNALGIVASRQGEYDRTREYFERSLEIKREVGDRSGEANLLNNLGLIDIQRGAFDRARERLERSFAIKEDLEYRRGLSETLNNLGVLARRRGAFDRAETHFERGLAVDRDIDDRQGEAATLNNLGELARSRGAYDDARETLERSLEIKRELGDRQGEANTLTQLGELARERGAYDRAQEYHEAAADVFEADGDPFEAAQGRLSRARLALARGRAEEARERAERLHEEFAEMDGTYWAALARRLQGNAAARTGDADAARDHWRTALATFEETGAPQDALETLEALVETCREAGDAEAAARWCERARDVLADAPDPVVEHHGEWVERECGPDGE